MNERREQVPLPQCPVVGCAGRLLAHLRERGVALFLPPGRHEISLFTLDGTIFSWTVAPEAQALIRVPEVAHAVAHHKERISLLLLAELGGRN